MIGVPFALSKCPGTSIPFLADGTIGPVSLWVTVIAQDVDFGNWSVLYFVNISNGVLVKCGLRSPDQNE